MKKQLIVENALELFSKQGVEATSIQQITDKCGISKGAFYLVFKSKDELIFSLIDQFIAESTEEIERIVNSNTSNEDLLRAYLQSHFSTFVRNSRFAKLFIKDHSFIFNKDLFNRLQGYQAILTKLTEAVILKKYPNLAQHMTQDVVFFVSALTRTYTEVILFSHEDIDLDLLCNATEEKIDLVARNATIPFMTSANFFNQCSAKPFNKETLTSYFQNFELANENPILSESIALLTEHLQQNHLPAAVEQGLLNNLKNSFETKHLVYLYNVGQLTH